MPLTQRDYDLEELRSLERRLADVDAPSRRTTATTLWKYRQGLEERIEELRNRLAVGEKR